MLSKFLAKEKNDMRIFCRTHNKLMWSQVQPNPFSTSVKHYFCDRFQISVITIQAFLSTTSEFSQMFNEKAFKGNVRSRKIEKSKEWCEDSYSSGSWLGAAQCWRAEHMWQHWWIQDAGVSCEELD